MEEILAEQFIMQTLSQDATLQPYLGAGNNARIYARKAARSATFPYVIYTKQSSQDVYAAAATESSTSRIWSSLLYQIVVHTTGNSKVAIAPIYSRMDTLLSDPRPLVLAAGLTPNGGVVNSCRREQSVELPETDGGGKDYIGVGGIYRINVSAY